MKARLLKSLNANVHPLLLTLPCALLLAGLGQASIFVTQIGKTEENIQAMNHQPYPHQLWLNPHRAEILAPYLAEAK
jgi:hypothetical protein